MKREIAITGSAGVGKTTTLLTLAAAFASAGQGVVIWNGETDDIKFRSMVKDLLNINGLTVCVINHNATVDDIAKSMDTMYQKFDREHMCLFVDDPIRFKRPTRDYLPLDMLAGYFDRIWYTQQLHRKGMHLTA